MILNRWEPPEPAVQNVVDELTTLVVHSGLFSNFIGCVVNTKPPELLLSMVHHYLSSLATGPYNILTGFQIQKLHVDYDTQEFLIQIIIQHGNGKPWHTHCIVGRGEIVLNEDGTLFEEGGDGRDSNGSGNGGGSRGGRG